MITIGVDEVGRGCWAGPLLAAAVAFDTAAAPPPGLNDSKKLSRIQRQTADADIRAAALVYGIGWIEPEAIDISGITWAVKSAMTDAVEAAIRALPRQFAGQPIEIIVDGSYNYLAALELPDHITVRTLVGADGLIPAASAASILAKVARDAYMCGPAHAAHPSYGFDRHVGYGTAAHISALKTHGVTPIHRKSYKPIQAMLQSGA